jgi:hypothetical protein
LGVPEGVDVGQITVVEVDGTLAVVGNECAFTAQGTPVQGDLGLRGRQVGAVVFTRSLGKAMLITNLEFTAIADTAYMGWADTTGIAMWVDAVPGIVFFQSAARISVREGAASAEVGVYAATTDYDIAVVLGGYDTNGVPWDNAQVPANFLYGAAVFIRGGAFTDWTILWRTVDDNTASLEAIISIMAQAGTLDDFRVPVVNYSPVLQPTNKSTFTAANGTSLDAITPEVGGTWTEQNGDWDIQGNQTNVVANGGAAPWAIATVQSNIADIFLRATSTTAIPNALSGIICRFSDINNYWMALPNGVGNIHVLFERNGGVDTLRASAAVAIGAGTYLTAYLDGAARITFVSAFNAAATIHGMRGRNVGDDYDNFHIQPRDGTYSLLDRCA